MEGVCVFRFYFFRFFCIYIGRKRMILYDILFKGFEFMNFVNVRKMVILFFNYLGFYFYIYLIN